MRAILPAALALALGVSNLASAHVVFADPKAEPGAYYAGFLRISHGCAGSATTSIRVEIPSSVVSAKPQPKAGWSIKIERQALASPMRSEGGQPITERVSAITWSGNLPADEFDQFGILMKMPESLGPLYFPTRQTCASGESDWVNIPPRPQDWHKTANPAPVLNVVGSGDGMKM